MHTFAVLKLLFSHLFAARPTTGIGRISYAEFADIHIAYGAANGNSRKAVKIYRIRFSNRHVTVNLTFAAIHRRLRETE